MTDADDRGDGSTHHDSADGPHRDTADDPRDEAWRAMVRAHARIVRELAQNLETSGKVSLGTYEVLSQIAEAGGRLRLRDLVERVVLSQPGLSRKVTRLSEQGLVDREPDPHDGRGVLVTLTDQGRNAVESAQALHRAGIEREFTAHIDEDEARLLVRIFDRLAEPNGAAGPG